MRCNGTIWPILLGILASAPAVPAASPVADGVGAGPAAGSAAEPVVPPPIVFEGFGLGDFQGGGSIAAALRKIDARDDGPEPPLGLPLDLVVKGPAGRDRLTDPLRAELQGRLEGLDLVAGMQADPALVTDGPAKWTGAVRLSTLHPEGKEVLELRTSLDRRQQDGVVKLELGPRIERRLRRGAVLFIDGKAQAQARRSPESGGWLLPGLTEGQGLGALGVNASTGVTR